ncbi:MAG: metallophosphoesterase [Simkaniaceae bacterium]
MSEIRIAHISDVHFSKFCFSPLQFFSKRWLGSANLLLKRGRLYINEKVKMLPDFLKNQGVTDLLITGDLTTTSQKSEYQLARIFIDEVKKRGIHTFLIPGNHDHYTRFSDRTRRFYHYFKNDFPTQQRHRFSLEKDKVAAFEFKEGFWIIALDTTLSTSLFLSNGKYSPEIDEKLKKVLADVPKDAKIILLNHFPFFANDKKKRNMEGGDLLEKRIRGDLRIQLYLHGHTHRQICADLRSNHLPIILDPGSISKLHNGSWNLLTLSKTQLLVQTFTSKERSPASWLLDRSASFELMV